MAQILPNDPRPPYVQIADELRRSIKAGELKPGDRLTSSRELAAEWGVAPMTIHQAIRVLRDEDLVVSAQGRGVYVRHADEASDANESHSTAEEQLSGIHERLERLEQLVGDQRVDGEIEDLKRQVGNLSSQMIDLYAKLGQPYPREASVGSDGKRTRRAAE
ncbi:DNA-binding GntR family transcriptional regulator [Allocatelliglobosispora scoriae]|uniref:DNA-binding GntR family transcriptional regulator n=1 Tax=Allocatelliglobosispora scoriae TaxID=643052 RepID=A0A841BNC3_9ACTN|nr:GntR family transcriptional regulator [Allocatelliglobosispora scoriae]MBB5870587.1 DNA-binding GntR family transcriptional regulator [Allocatelliglobosispora scoriae]